MEAASRMLFPWKPPGFRSWWQRATLFTNRCWNYWMSKWKKTTVLEPTLHSEVIVKSNVKNRTLRTRRKMH